MTPPESASAPLGPVEQQEIQRFARDVVTRATDSGQTSLENLLPLVYEEFRTLAGHLMRKERTEHTLRPTALANEAYIRLAGQTGAELHGRTHLLAVAATAMRRVLIDHARARKAVKRGGAEQERITLGDDLVQSRGSAPLDVLDLNRALEKLSVQAPRKVQTVELLYFAGLTFEEAGAALGVSTRTVVRDWRFAKAWLWKELGEAMNMGPPDSADPHSSTA